MIYRGLAIFVAKQTGKKLLEQKFHTDSLLHCQHIPFTVSVFQDADLKPSTKPSNMVL